MYNNLRLYNILLIAVFFFISTADVFSANEKAGIVLLPIEGKSIDPKDAAFYDSIIEEVLSEKYNAYGGKTVTEYIDKIAKNRHCINIDCQKQLTSAFSSRLAGQGRIDKYKENYLLYFEIKDTKNNQIELSWARTCNGCSKNMVAKRLEEMLRSGVAIAFADKKGKTPKPAEKISAESKKPILVINTVPKGAQITINGVKAGITPYQNTNFKAGSSLTVGLKKSGYKEKTLQVKIKSGKNVFGDIIMESLEPSLGKLYIETKPSGASVYLDSIKIGITPYENSSIKTGHYSVGISKHLYSPIKDYKIEIFENKKTERKFTLKPNFGTLSVESDPYVAKIAIFNSKNKSVVNGFTPLKDIKLETGKYKILIEKPGFDSIDLPIIIEKDESVDITKQLAKLEAITSEISVSTQPALKNAKIYVNGVEKGIAPGSFILSSGNYEVMVKAGDKIGINIIKLEKSEKQNIVVEMKEVKNKDIETYWVPTVDMKLVYIKPYPFIMGDLEDSSSNKEELQHKVTLTSGYFIGEREVTQGQWARIMGNNPSYFSDCGSDCPVEMVSWKDVNTFILKLNLLENTKKYRLPTEAEWEYAARAYTESPFAFGYCLLAENANYNAQHPLPKCPRGIFRGKTVKTGSLEPNELGLYDMHGNVWEWCSDWYGDYPNKDVKGVVDPRGPKRGDYKVARGGSWRMNAWYCRSSNRGGYSVETN